MDNKGLVCECVHEIKECISKLKNYLILLPKKTEYEASVEIEEIALGLLLLFSNKKLLFFFNLKINF